jgi:flagellar biosynthesis/type III secretory pathway protein FliH
MDTMEMTGEMTGETTDWSFPELDQLNLTNNDEMTALLFPEIHKQIDEALDTIKESNKNATDSANERDNPHEYDHERFQELEKLKSDYESRLVYLNNIIDKLKTPLSIIDAELLEVIQDIIKKMTKRIICKEITTDPNIFTQIINDLKSMLDTKDGMITIYLSEKDYHQFNTSNHHTLGLTNIDSSLNQGDVIIKSNFAEIRALLDDRIEQLIRIQHD